MADEQRFEVEQTSEDTWYSVTDRETERKYTICSSYWSNSDSTEIIVFDAATDDEVVGELKTMIVEALP